METGATTTPPGGPAATTPGATTPGANPRGAATSGAATPPGPTAEGTADDPRAERLAAVTAAVVATAFVVQVVRTGNLATPFFYDEMWRVDLIRAANPFPLMLDHDTPVAPGWVLGLHLLTWPLPERPALYRALTLAAAPAFAASATVLLHRIAARRPDPRHPIGPWVCAASATLVTAMPAVTGYYYLNGYLFELAYLTIATLALLELGHRRWALPTWAALLAALPLFVIGGVLAAPALAAGGLWWAWRRPPTERRRALAVTGGATAAGAVLAAAVFGLLYRPVSAKPSITSWWIAYDATFGSHLGAAGLATKAAGQLRDTLIPFRVGDAVGDHAAAQVALAVAVVAAAATGAWSLGRRWGWILAIPLTGRLLTVPAGLAIHWPVTIERVNLCFDGLLFLVIAFGLVRLVTWPLGRHPVAAAAVAATLVLAWSPVPQPPDPEVFAKHLPADLELVAASPAARNVVLAYHWMSWPYVHDALINDDHPGHAFELVRDHLDDPSLYRPVDQLAAEHGLRPGDRLWCVKPFQLAEQFDAACRVTPGAPLREVARRRSDGSEIVGYEVTPT